VQELCHFEKDHQIIGQSVEITVSSENELAIIRGSCLKSLSQFRSHRTLWDTVRHGETFKILDGGNVFKKKLEKGVKRREKWTLSENLMCFMRNGKNI
jgi:hypothetical protein